jgi:hypothetical protein
MSDAGSDLTSAEKIKKRTNDKVKHIRNWDQVEDLYIQTDSPTFKQACDNLGICPSDC